jgi:HK97 family phage prohead protease
MKMKKQWKRGDRVECDVSFEATTVSDKPDGYIAGIASAPSTDLYGHKVLAGAFDQSIKKKGLRGPRGVKLLAFHDWSKIAGTIDVLETKGDKLLIEGQLNLNVSYVRDLYEVTKGNGGLNFSVGFTLLDFEFVEPPEDPDEDPDPDENQLDSDGADGLSEPPAWLVIKQGDLMEVSVVPFPAQLEAEMTFVKRRPIIPGTMAEFEKALVADGLCRSRSEAHKFAMFAKSSAHLFGGKPAPSGPTSRVPNRPLLDVSKLRAATDLAVKVKAMLGSR